MSNERKKRPSPGPIVPQPLPGGVPARVITTEGAEWVGITSYEQPDPTALTIETLLGVVVIPLAETETLEVI